eukprot:gnl/TRDRNA2_/TRDRNA2_180223_c0_seq1.p1 gnl/TRDRNA2_/TRDRNA2_180223_c0~~gnl/TRDRNA2_/TRDRNA2_180223_c0_seq1.p1  ORF type:complete len:108 (-),score=21.96 gnl/TRDRNA2_/TRDRNA2_180223_c0_seq1:112-435(-)
MSAVIRMDKIMPILGGLAGGYCVFNVLPVMYRWELIPGVGSDEYKAKAAKIKYNYYTEGIVYSPYDTGEPETQLPEYAKGKMYLKSKRGGWKMQDELYGEFPEAAHH